VEGGNVRGINRVIISGNASDSARFQQTGGGTPCATFKLACDRRGANKGETVTAWVKINVYGDALVEICKARLHKGAYLIVEGELMNRDGAVGEVTEVRAKEVIFLDGESATP
jgi:single stranded DNA-binding protein